MSITAFRDLSIRTKISVLVGGMFLLLLVVLLFAFRQMAVMQHGLNSVVEQNIPLLRSLGRVSAAQYRRAVLLERALQAGRQMESHPERRQDFQSYREQLDSIHATIQEELKSSIQLLQGFRPTSLTRTKRDKRLLKIDYELRGALKEYADCRFVSERALNLLSLGRRQAAWEAVTRMGREREELTAALNRLRSRVETFSADMAREATQSQRTANIALIVSSGTALLLAVALGTLTVWRITGPLERAARAARRISAGERELEIEAAARDETGELLSAMRDMLESINEAEDRLRQREAMYGAVVENIPQKIFMKDRNFRYMSINESFARDLGIEPEEAVGKTDRAFFPPELAEKYRADDERVMSEEVTDEFDEEYVEDGEKRIVHTTKTPVRDENGNVIGVLGIFRDVTERRRAEQKLEETLKELERSNQELEHFAYVVSHDLQEPLRMVTSYVQLLKKRYEGQLDSDADEFIGFAADGATRMQKMINDLLQYSRVGTRGNPPEPTDCNELLEKALQNLEVAIDESDAEVTCDELPTVQADESQLIQLFQNLVGNAIKFRSDDPPRVRIGARRKDGDWLFSVSDNGIGMEPEQADRIFKVFQRLHGRDKYPGTGIGLAVCKRIVERHGGDIWVDSEPGQGSTFYFTIPGEEAEE